MCRVCLRAASANEIVGRTAEGRTILMRHESESIKSVLTLLVSDVEIRATCDLAGGLDYFLTAGQSY